MIKLKRTVLPKNLIIMAACSNAADEMNLDIYITSGNDSEHMVRSKHYTNEALDIRSKDFPNQSLKHSFLARVLERLGSKYDGLLEDEGRANEHFHIEYDPKDGR